MKTRAAQLRAKGRVSIFCSRSLSQFRLILGTRINVGAKITTMLKARVANGDRVICS